MPRFPAQKSFLQGQYVEVGINACGVYGGNCRPTYTALGPGPHGRLAPQCRRRSRLRSRPGRGRLDRGNAAAMRRLLCSGQSGRELGHSSWTRRNGLQKRLLGLWLFCHSRRQLPDTPIWALRVRATWEGNLTLLQASNLNIVQETVSAHRWAFLHHQRAHPKRWRSVGPGPLLRTERGPGQRPAYRRHLCNHKYGRQPTSSSL